MGIGILVSHDTQAAEGKVALYRGIAVAMILLRHIVVDRALDSGLHILSMRHFHSFVLPPVLLPGTSLGPTSIAFDRSFIELVFGRGRVSKSRQTIIMRAAQIESWESRFETSYPA